MTRAREHGWRTLTLTLCFAFLYAPIVWIVVFSFAGDPHASGAGQLSLHWYRMLRDNDGLRDATLRSLQLALMSSPVATALGTFAGVSLARLERFPGRSMLIALLAVPIFAPEVLLGFAFLMLFAGFEAVTGLAQGKGMATLVIAHATLGCPVVASIVFARVMDLDKSLEAAARDLGARPLRVFATVTLPLAAPAILSGWLLALTLSFDDVVTSSFLAGPENTTLPMAIFSALRTGIDPQINAVGTLLVAGVSLIVALSFVASRLRPATNP